MDQNTIVAPTITFRTHRPGDMGYIIHRHGLIYAREYGWDERFEGMVARIAADFVQHYDTTKERCWIAERNGEFLGSILLVGDKDNENVARLRLLFVEPSSRGLGVGKQLVQQSIAFAKSAGYVQVVLYTQSILSAACRIYESFGFRITQEVSPEPFAPNSTGQIWACSLNSLNTPSAEAQDRREDRT
ncbi:acetyltransferase [Dactylonectria macrodidyma]|uniref:Acetyltransferase n=1 Tax=Dactylonectria macrodidyma TaxID=307937 RepID=A0A9P9DHZ4_9HYPO|nr:acetyltransferase [Dactylonectria macrodidyma]